MTFAAATVHSHTIFGQIDEAHAIVKKLTGEREFKGYQALSRQYDETLSKQS